MAGDWIKMRVDLGDDPAVILMASKLDVSEDEIVGKLHRLWCWADKHTTDGTAPAITARWVDRYVNRTGFADAMILARWISFSEEGVEFPEFDRHNGGSAKKRVEATLRQRLSRKNRDEGVTGEARTSIPRPFVRHVLERDGYKCVFCGTQSDEKKEAGKKPVLSVDHLVPITRGGSASVDNLACACRACNNEKNDRTPEEWGLSPTFLQPGVTYKDGAMSQKNCDGSVTREEKRREEKDKPPIPPKGGEGDPPSEKKSAIAFKTFLENCRSSGEKPIPEGDTVFSYADETGIPLEFLRLHWMEFKERYGMPDSKRYKDWRSVYRKSVRGNWFRIWYLRGDNECGLTTQGEQARRHHKEAA